MVASGPLAYVFWHCARDGVTEYEERLIAFHESLALHPPRGFRRSLIRRYESLPWAPAGATVYEDWYVVADFGSLGDLNEAAVTGARQASHDRAAGAAAWGAAGIYRAVGEIGVMEDHRFALWFSKPDDIAYGSFLEPLEGRAGLWQRQMVLGPAREFCLYSQLPSDARLSSADGSSSKADLPDVYEAPFSLIRG